MLRELHVRDLAVLADVSVRFESGLNVLSGETGAGKSLLVDSLALLAGARASADLIRHGADALVVVGLFDPAGSAWRETLAEAGVPAEEGEELVIRREVSRDGPNRVYVNDHPVTLRLVAALAPGLMRIHTQREELGLFSPELQRRWLDLSGGDDAGQLVRRAAERHGRYAELASRLERAEGNERLRAERIDLLRFQAGEIDAAGIVEGEEVALRQERETLRHSEAITRALGSSYAELAEDEGAATDRLARCRRQLLEIVQWEREAEAWAGELEELSIRIDELARSIRDRLDGVSADPRRLDAIEERLAALERLFRKYGDTSEELLARRAAIAAELDDLEGDEEQRGRLRRQAEEALAAYQEAASALSAARRRWGEELSARIHAELADLAMAKARFSVELERRPSSESPLEVDGERVEFSAHGYDHVVFELAANPGEESQPLSRVASGGELSRVYLALQLAILPDAATRPALVFDEIDAGIGGAEAAALGGKLQRLAGGGQVLVVTHLPQVASFADRHCRVRKRVVEGRTEMAVETLDLEARVEEVARMLAGREVTDLSRSHARELIETAGRAGR